MIAASGGGGGGDLADFYNGGFCGYGWSGNEYTGNGYGGYYSDGRGVENTSSGNGFGVGGHGPLMAT